mmetsp:Transcript_18414/g.52789  ORF Transcript_18414/g.52789 Transcript_18414/m.52789 type:complete len:275 (+) Transcript_18414:1779-2603(+)
MPGRSSWNCRRWPCTASSDWTRTVVHSPCRRGRTETSHGGRRTCGGGSPRTRRARLWGRGTIGRRTRAEAGGWGSAWSATAGWPRARRASSRTCTRGGASYSPPRADRPGGRDATRTHSPWNSSRAVWYVPPTPFNACLCSLLSALSGAVTTSALPIRTGSSPEKRTQDVLWTNSCPIRHRREHTDTTGLPKLSGRRWTRSDTPASPPSDQKEGELIDLSIGGKTVAPFGSKIDPKAPSGQSGKSHNHNARTSSRPLLTSSARCIALLSPSAGE